jgi:hypothetical protein
MSSSAQRPPLNALRAFEANPRHWGTGSSNPNPRSLWPRRISRFGGDDQARKRIVRAFRAIAVYSVSSSNGGLRNKAFNQLPAGFASGAP